MTKCMFFSSKETSMDCQTLPLNISAKMVGIGLSLTFLLYPKIVHAEDCSKALDPNLKSFMESTDTRSATAAFGHWASTADGSSWAKSNSQNGSLSFLGDFKLDLGYESKTGNKGSTTHNATDNTQQSFSNQQLTTLRQEITTTEQWRSYQTCILSQSPKGRLIFGSLAQVDTNDWHPVTLKLSSNRISDAIPTAIITSMSIYGANTDFTNWTGKKVSEDMTQILTRESGKALVITISTTLGSYSDSLPAVNETQAVEVHPPYCDACALLPTPPNGIFCLGRFNQYWSTKLANHGLTQEDGDGLPVRLRTQRLMAQCRVLTLTGTLSSQPPTAFPRESAVNYQQRIGQLRQSLQNQLQQSQQEINDLENQLNNQGDRWFQRESYTTSDPVTFCQHNPYLCQWLPIPSMVSPAMPRIF